MKGMGALTRASDVREVITMRDGFVAARNVLQRLWDIEARGASFVITETGGHRAGSYVKQSACDPFGAPVVTDVAGDEARQEATNK